MLFRSVTVKTQGAKTNSPQVIEASMNVGEALDLRSLVPGVVDWESNDESVATVSTEGIVKALTAEDAEFTGLDNNGELIRIVIAISDENVLELGDIEMGDFDGGIVEDFGTDEEIQTDEEPECVSKFAKMHFRRLELHFCVDFP